MLKPIAITFFFLVVSTVTAQTPPPSKSASDQADPAAVAAALDRLNAKTRVRHEVAEQKAIVEKLQKENAELRAEIATLQGKLKIQDTVSPPDKSPGGPPAPLGNPDVVTMKVGDGHFEIRRGTDIVYLPSDGWATLRGHMISWEYYDAAGKNVSPTEGFYEISGQPQRVTVTVDDQIITTDPLGRESVPDVVRIFPRDFLFKSEGQGKVQLSIDGHSTTLTFEAVRIPIKVGSSSASVIDRLGMPSEKVSVLAVWPEGAGKDGISYYPTAEEGFSGGDHWRFKNFRNLVVVIVDGKVHQIVSIEPDKK